MPLNRWDAGIFGGLALLIYIFGSFVLEVLIYVCIDFWRCWKSLLLAPFHSFPRHNIFHWHLGDFCGELDAFSGLAFNIVSFCVGGFHLGIHECSLIIQILQFQVITLTTPLKMRPGVVGLCSHGALSWWASVLDCGSFSAFNLCCLDLWGHNAKYNLAHWPFILNNNTCWLPTSYGVG